MKIKEKPVICFGLERFRDFRLLRILFAHEYAHFLLNLGVEEIPGESRLKWLLISEGIATYFTFLAFPNYKLSDHFLFQEETLIWCQTNEAFLREIYSLKTFSIQRATDIYYKGDGEFNVPPRAGKYLGFQSVKNYLAQDIERTINLIINDKMKALVLEI
ncbi:DUF2268 domain-containing putative Zn-dependent protease [Acidobacteriota bacterium]